MENLTYAIIYLNSPSAGQLLFAICRHGFIEFCSILIFNV